MRSKTIVMAGMAMSSAALLVYAIVLTTGSDATSTPSESESADSVTRLAPRHHGSSSAGPSRPFLPLRRGVEARSSSPADESPPGLPSEAEIAEELRHQQAREDDFRARFDAESVDAQWAARWESGIATALDSSLGELPGFGEISIECHRTRCLAEASWDSYSAATLALSTAADATKGACATSVFMPPPVDPAAPYRHVLRFSSCQDAPS